MNGVAPGKTSIEPLPYKSRASLLKAPHSCVRDTLFFQELFMEREKFVKTRGLNSFCLVAGKRGVE
jgi:hypothetical protein